MDAVVKVYFGAIGFGFILLVPSLVPAKYIPDERYWKFYYVLSIIGLYLITLMATLGSNPLDEKRPSVTFLVTCVTDPIPHALGILTYETTSSAHKAFAATVCFATIQAVALGFITKMVTFELKMLFALIYAVPILVLLAVVMKAVGL